MLQLGWLRGAPALAFAKRNLSYGLRPSSTVAMPDENITSCNGAGGGLGGGGDRGGEGGELGGEGGERAFVVSPK